MKNHIGTIINFFVIIHLGLGLASKLWCKLRMHSLRPQFYNAGHNKNVIETTVMQEPTLSGLDWIKVQQHVANDVSISDG